MITTILFDLDGTLLPMDQDRFIESYIRHMAIKMAPHGYDPKTLAKAVWAGTEAMARNNGEQTNEVIFWKSFESIYGAGSRKDEPLFVEFYETSFQEVSKDCGFAPEAAASVRKLKSMGLRVALATNPFFPAIATHSRIRWAGLEPSDFELITTFENSGRCKPNPAYFQDVLEKLKVKPEECIMVGNDTLEDAAAEKLGIPVFYLTHSLINKQNVDISEKPHGGFAEMLDFIRGYL